jgi:hypothetical protein
MPISRDTTSGAALSGASNRATALSLNACPYRAKFVLHRRPQGWSIGATTILTRGAQTYLGAFAYRFNHRFDLRDLIANFIVDAARTKSTANRVIRGGHAEARF